MRRMSQRLDTARKTSIVTAPEVSQKATCKMPLRTYSRRSLKRRHTAPLILETERTIRRIQSLTVTTSQPSVTTQQTHVQLTANTGRKRPRFTAPVGEDKTPNELVWEALTSSAPNLVQHVENAVDELHVAEEPIDRQSDTEVTNDGPTGQDIFDPIVEEQVPHKDASEYEEPEGVSSEEPADDICSSESGQDVDGDTTTLTPSSQGEDSCFFATSGSQKPRSKPPFLIFDKSPPQGYKVLRKRKASPVHKTSAKKRNRLSDGFSAEEARPSPFGRRRRLHQLDSEVGSLELTQKSAASQQIQKTAPRKPEKGAQPHTNTGRWHRRQYFGTSQFESESHDPVELSELNHEEAEGEDLPPTTVSFRSSQGSADDVIDFIIIPQRDPPRSTGFEESASAAYEWDGLEANKRADSHLPPKRMFSVGFEDLNGLTLRPDPLSWF